jgi:hypothetical protein
MTPTVPGPASARDAANGLGDILLYPLMFGWAKGDFKYDLRLCIHAPTGDYVRFKVGLVF